MQHSYTRMAGTIRHHGLGKLDIAMHALVVGANDYVTNDRDRFDLRIRVNDARVPLWLALNALQNVIPDELMTELATIVEDLDEIRPCVPQVPKDDKLFGGRKGQNAKRSASELAERIISLVESIHRYDATASLHESQIAKS